LTHGNRCIPGCCPTLHAGTDIFGDDDAVIHQQSKGDDHGGNGYPLQFDVEDRHGNHAEQHNQWDEGAYDQAGAQSQCQYNYHEYDDHRLA